MERLKINRAKQMVCRGFFIWAEKIRDYLKRKFPNLSYDIVAYNFERPRQNFLEITCWSHEHGNRWCSTTHRARIRFYPGTMTRTQLRKDIKDHLNYRKQALAIERKMRRNRRK